MDRDNSFSFIITATVFKEQLVTNMKTIIRSVKNILIMVCLFVCMWPNNLLAQTNTQVTNGIHYMRNGNLFIVEDDIGKNTQTIQIERITDTVGTTSYIVTCLHWSQRVNREQLQNTISEAMTAQNQTSGFPRMAAIRKTARLIYEDIIN